MPCGELRLRASAEAVPAGCSMRPGMGTGPIYGSPITPTTRRPIGSGPW
jgi:hypothetical protein